MQMKIKMYNYFGIWDIILFMKYNKESVGVLHCYKISLLKINFGYR